MSKTIDFNDLSRGTVVDNEYSSQGVTISGVTSAGVSGRAMIFDTNSPTGGDTDLASDNLDNVLIISEDGDHCDPDDNARGGLLRFDFADGAKVQSLTFFDIEEGAAVRFYNEAGDLIATRHVVTDDNGQLVADFHIDGVFRMDVQLNGSGAVDNLVFDDFVVPDGTVEGTSGDDVIDVNYTGDPEGDRVDAQDAVLPGAAPNDDLIYGYGGDDTIIAGSGDDKVFGGQGDDSIDGGTGDDVIHGGSGNDQITTGTGFDIVYGGADADTITATGSGWVLGGSGGDDNDTLDVTGQGPFILTSPDGTGSPIPDGNGNGFDGCLVFVDEDGNPTGQVIEFREIENIIGDDPINRDPSATDDAFTTGEDDPADLGNVVGNDDDPDGDALTVAAVNGDSANVGEAVAGSNGGLVTLNADGSLSFDPNDAFEDLGDGETRDTTVTYTVSDPDGATSTATVTITVTGSNDGPVAVDSSYVVSADEAAGDEDANAITDDTGLGADSDPEGDALTIVAVAGDPANVGQSVAGDAGGLFVINADGTVDFNANGEFDDLGLGESVDTSVSYTIVDENGAEDTANITFTVTGKNDGTVQGTAGDDIINPDIPFVDADGDAVDGLDGILPGDEGTNNDVIDAMGGDDTVFAGLGEDDVFGGTGDDLLDGGQGNDTLFGGDGSDNVYGGEGNDVIDTSIPNTGAAPDVGYPFQTPDPASGNPFPFPGYDEDTDPDNDKDFVSGGSGDDTIRTGDDDDTIYGDSGNDTISAGFDDDLVFGGSGNDLIEGSEGNDEIDGGAGDDTIYGGLEDPFADLVSFPDDEPDANGFQDLVPENNGDTIFGGAGNDTIYGQDDDDTLFGGIGDDLLDGGVDDDVIAGDAGNDTVIGGQGDDSIDGGADNDTLFGGAGNDTLDGGDDDDVIAGGIGDDTITGGDGDDVAEGGAGADEITGGAGSDALFGGQDSDVFIGGNGGDVVVGGEDADGTDVDVLDLTDSNVDRIEYIDGDPEAGTVFFNDGSTMTFSEIENVIPCFTPGTLIATPRGERPVEDLQVGDRVITRDNGIQEIAWLGRKPISGTQLIQNPHLKPILIKRGSLGQGLPERDMMVSPNHRMLVASDKTQLYFEENEVLAAAKHMVGANGIQAVDVMQTTYIHFMFERHEVVLSNGAWTESFQPGDYSLKGIGNSQRNEIFELFPELATVTGLEDYQSARKSLKKHEAKLLLD